MRESDRLLNRMLHERRLDRYEIESREPEALLHIRSMCARCNNQERCANELDAGTAVARAAEFCPNALVMGALSREFGETVRVEQD